MYTKHSVMHSTNYSAPFRLLDATQQSNGTISASGTSRRSRAQSQPGTRLGYVAGLGTLPELPPAPDSALLPVSEEQVSPGDDPHPTSRGSSRRASFQDDVLDEELAECITEALLGHLGAYVPPRVLTDLAHGVDLRWHTELREVSTIFIGLASEAEVTSNLRPCREGEYAYASTLQTAYGIVARETERLGGETGGAKGCSRDGVV